MPNYKIIATACSRCPFAIVGTESFEPRLGRALLISRLDVCRSRNIHPKEICQRLGTLRMLGRYLPTETFQ